MTLPQPLHAVRTALPRTVIILGLVSLLHDAASEMIAPLPPIFLTATQVRALCLERSSCATSASSRFRDLSSTIR